MNISRLLILVLAILLFTASAPATPPLAAQEICFPENSTTPCLPEPFAAFWATNGGLPVFGYPLSAPVEEARTNGGQPLLVQWTERHRLELHPENAPPYNVLLSRLGAEQLQARGRDPMAEPREAGPLPGCLWFEETGHNVCNQSTGIGFRAFWENNGLNDPLLNDYQRSLALFGFPLTAAQEERNLETGEVYLTQWFERARFEWHPENPDEFKVLLGLLGREVEQTGAPTTQPAAPAPDTAALPFNVFGGEINRGRVDYTAERARAANVTWVRYNAIRWSDVEPQPGQRDWSQLAEFEQEIQQISAQGIVPMVIVTNVPPWARQFADSVCGPIAPEHRDAFAAFVAELVRRYSGPPYNVRYWEIGNEPDAIVSTDPTIPFGCWGRPDQPYFGGGDYAAMLQQVYPAVKAANPAAQVVLGGLLLDCDPANPPEGKDCRIAEFLTGVLENGGGDAFDVLAYHGYAFWNPTRADWDRTHPYWQHRGGVLLGKLDLLRSTMAQYGIDKPVLANEIGLLCSRGNEQFCLDNGLRQDQANYLVRTYTRALAHDIAGAAWYTINSPGWRLGGMIPREGEPTMAYYALQFLASTLTGARLEADLSRDALLEGYAFRKGSAQYQVYWMNNDTQRTIPLPANTTALYTMVGEPLPLEGETLTIGFAPVIVQVGE